MQRPIGLGAPPRGLTSCGASDPQNCTHNLFPAPTPARPVAPPAWSPRPPLHHCCCAATCLVMPSQVPTKAPPSPPGHLAPPGSWLPVGITLIPLTPPVLIPRKPPEVTQGLRLTWALNPALTQLPSAPELPWSHWDVQGLFPPGPALLRAAVCPGPGCPFAGPPCLPNPRPGSLMCAWHASRSTSTDTDSRCGPTADFPPPCPHS